MSPTEALRVLRLQLSATPMSAQERERVTEAILVLTDWLSKHGGHPQRQVH